MQVYILYFTSACTRRLIWDLYVLWEHMLDREFLWSLLSCWKLPLDCVCVGNFETWSGTKCVLIAFHCEMYVQIMRLMFISIGSLSIREIAAGMIGFVILVSMIAAITFDEAFWLLLLEIIKFECYHGALLLCVFICSQSLWKLDDAIDKGYVQKFIR